MTEPSQRLTCLRCGGHTVRPVQRPARTVSYRVFAALPLPADLPIPTCSRCRAECLDPDTTRRLHEILPSLYQAELRRLAGLRNPRIVTAQSGSIVTAKSAAS